jgi:hypothetical protein
MSVVELPKPFTEAWFAARYARHGDTSMFYSPVCQSKGYTREQCHILDCFVQAWFDRVDYEAPYDLLHCMKKTYLDFQRDYEPGKDVDEGVLDSLFDVTRIWSEEIIYILGDYRRLESYRAVCQNELN